jgi:lipoprotein NlpI
MTLRGEDDEAASQFERGMNRYRQGDYSGARSHLRAAAALDPSAPHVLFFLGISHLMLGQVDAAVERLEATLRLGDTPYTEQAHWYLAKAFLQKRDIAAAEHHLNLVIGLHGSRAAEARGAAAALARLDTRHD